MRVADTWQVIEAECPYCQHVQGVDDQPWDDSTEPDEQQCAECGKSFIYWHPNNWRAK